MPFKVCFTRIVSGFTLKHVGMQRVQWALTNLCSLLCALWAKKLQLGGLSPQGIDKHQPIESIAGPKPARILSPQLVGCVIFTTLVI